MPNLRGHREDRLGRHSFLLTCSKHATPAMFCVRPRPEQKLMVEAVPPDALSFSPASPSSRTFSA